MGTKISPLEQDLWNKWKHNQDDDAANQLIQQYMHLVHYHVERTMSHLPNSVMKDDIKSLALFGLYDALKKFDLDRDLKFDTYASFRIRGAIIDGLRKEDWLPRSIREKTKKIEQATQKLEQLYQREPTSMELANALDMSVQEVETYVRDSLFANMLSIEDKPKDGKSEHKEGIGYAIPDNKSVQPDEHIVKNEQYKDLADSIKGLKENEQMIISLFYQDGLTFTEIGQVLGLTTSRISQIHKKAIFKLRNKLQEAL
ncbi:FliA/WhiG family RNA polymerase sigma factor [Ornithinibacillus sp. BX22]|uniref:FliA/WhiG family RNA polymerase sigma factor n=2 Tax=Ornithinibacillus TaxID=484508 RepID=A0A923L402_9BACI|nr:MULTISPECIES: FliA/WhiG family RNA polymerase sigma factor [Ornithinibacillus]MBC5635986.1 FliA/WhiG family RNA polymerase sigma factor [Ornithinibacillus hominis]MBS3680025.1 FliA/WhiG family RNA polymerase sigma factor [Ornithinibacillus massiliensis]